MSGVKSNLEDIDRVITLHLDEDLSKDEVQKKMLEYIESY